MPDGIALQTASWFHFLWCKGSNIIHIMKKIFTLILMTAIGISAYGQQTSVTRHANNGFSKTITTDRDGNIIRQEESKNPVKTVLKAENEDEGTQMTIYARIICPDDMEPVCVWHGSATFGECAYWEGKDVISLELDSNSTWDCENNVITAQFTKKNHTGNPEDRWFVIQKYDELVDGMEITFDGSEACNAYSFRFLNPDGEQVIPDHFMVDVDTKEYTLQESGNIQEAMGSISLYDSSYRFNVAETGFILNWRSYSDGRAERKCIEAPVFYLNNLPDDMAVCGELKACEKLEGNTLTALVMTTPNVREPGLITNNPDDYSEVSTDFIPDAGLYGDSMIGIFTDLVNNGFASTAYGVSYAIMCEAGEKVTCKTLLCLNQPTMKGADVMQVLYKPALRRPQSDIGITPQSIIQEEGKPIIKHFNKTFGDESNNLYCRTFEYWDDLDMFKVMNDKLPASPSDYDCIMGNCVPLLVSLGMWPEAYGPLPEGFSDYLLDMGWFTASYCGRSGEALLELLDLAQVRQTVDGAALTFTIDVDGAPVDGTVQSHNNAVMQCNIDKADWVPPTAQLLWFTDGTIVKDHFQTPENAVLHLYAADFRYTLNDAGDKDMMEAYPLESIKIEYAPASCGEFTEIEVSENADMFFTPGYGYCYEGSLAGIDRGSANGWMDLRITLTDDSGNVQTQTLSPAFRVDSLAGIEDIVPDSTGNTELYDLQGRKVGSNPIPGIYIRRSANRADKVIVR